MPGTGPDDDSVYEYYTATEAASTADYINDRNLKEVDSDDESPEFFAKNRDFYEVDPTIRMTEMEEVIREIANTSKEKQGVIGTWDQYEESDPIVAKGAGILLPGAVKAVNDALYGAYQAARGHTDEYKATHYDDGTLKPVLVEVAKPKPEPQYPELKWGVAAAGQTTVATVDKTAGLGYIPNRNSRLRHSALLAKRNAQRLGKVPDRN